MHLFNEILNNVWEKISIQTRILYLNYYYENDFSLMKKYDINAIH